METPPALTIARATLAEKPLLARLLQLYLHDFSGLAGIDDPHGEIGEDGTFAYPSFDRYWTEDRREPLLFRFRGRLAGFAFVSPWCPSGQPNDYAVAEFFILRKFRRAGLGTQAIRQMLAQRRGVWEIPVAEYNPPALAFWPRAISAVPGYEVSEVAGDGERWRGPIYRLSPRSLPG